VLSASNSSDTGFTEIEYSVTSPASCETVTPIGFISGWSVAETVTVPLLFSAVSLSLTVTVSVSASVLETVSHSFAAPDTSCVHSTATASTVRV